MAEPVKMPRQGLSVESCILIEWLKDTGDKVEEGDILFTYETDKSTFELEAEVEGILLAKFFEEGDEVPVLTNACVVGEEGESTEEFAPEGESEKKESKEPETDTETGHEEKEIAKIDKDKQSESREESTAQPSPKITKGDEEQIKISPRAKNLAEKNNIDIRQAQPTGPEGRIIERDIQKVIKEGPVYTPAAQSGIAEQEPVAQKQGSGIGQKITTSDLEQQEQVGKETGEFSEQKPEYEDVELTSIREKISEAMYQSVQSSAQLTLDNSFDASAILEYRKKIKNNKDDMDLENITLNDIILYTVSRTILNHEKLNAHFLEDKIRLFKNVNLGIAVDTERGLMVPTIFKANLKSLNQISREVKARAEECKNGSINPDYLQGGTFTVTNLGVLGIESFTPILNPPQTGILGINTIVQRVKEVDGEYINYPAIKLSLTFDHRAIDGAPAARFLQELKNNLENFNLMLAK